jgi:hypothetical protein
MLAERCRHADADNNTIPHIRMPFGNIKVSAALRARRQIGFPHRQITKRGIGRASVYRILA